MLVKDTIDKSWIRHMLPESRLYNFIDHKEGFSLQFLEGQKLIHDLAIIHDLKGAGFSYFRDSVLSIMPLIAFLKPGEGLGIFIDSEDPYFRFKIETNENGLMRTLLFPESFDLFPSKIKGVCRLAKILPGNAVPYNSIINLDNVVTKDVVNKIFKDSYQLKSSLKISQSSDQSVLINKLPPKLVDSELTDGRNLKLEDYWDEKKDQIEELFASAKTSELDIIDSIKNFGLDYLKSKEVRFHCNCSYDRMLSGILSLAATSGIDDVFLDGQKKIETRCDYCKTHYEIEKSVITEKLLDSKFH